MNKTLTAISLIALGFLMLLHWLGLKTYKTDMIYGFVFIAYGLSSTNFSLRNNERRMLLFSSILFLAGIVILIKPYYNIPDSRGLVLVSILFISGAVLILLFIDNMTQKTFLISGTVLILLSFFSLSVLQTIGLFQWVSKIANLFEVFWPIVLILIGLGLYINRKK
jgi:hypothetical protein